MKIEVAHRDYISKYDLAKALPMGRWFGFEAVGLDIDKGSFNRRMKNMPKEFIEHRFVGTSSQFKVKDGCLTALLAHCKVKKKPTQKQRAVKVKACNEKAEKEQALFNLALND